MPPGRDERERVAYEFEGSGESGGSGLRASATVSAKCCTCGAALGQTTWTNDSRASPMELVIRVTRYALTAAK